MEIKKDFFQNQVMVPAACSAYKYKNPWIMNPIKKEEKVKLLKKVLCHNTVYAASANLWRSAASLIFSSGISMQSSKDLGDCVWFLNSARPGKIIAASCMPNKKHENETGKSKVGYNQV